MNIGFRYESLFASRDEIIVCQLDTKESGPVIISAVVCNYSSFIAFVIKRGAYFRLSVAKKLNFVMRVVCECKRSVNRFDEAGSKFQAATKIITDLVHFQPDKVNLFLSMFFTMIIMVSVMVIVMVIVMAFFLFMPMGVFM